MKKYASEFSSFHYYDRAMCVVLPSKNEPFATTALEAMSRGCCVVASGVGGFTELIHDGEDGFLFEQGYLQSCKFFPVVVPLYNHILSVLFLILLIFENYNLLCVP